MKTAIIKEVRFIQDKKQTMGTCTVLGDNDQPLFSSLLLTRGWMDNQKNISCLPIGVYPVVKEYSTKYNRVLWEVKETGLRSEIKFHPLNFYFDSKGCNGLGRRPKFLNKDGYLDLTASKQTINEFHLSLKGFDRAILIITGNSPSIK